MRYWHAHWPKMAELKAGKKEGIPPYPLKDKAVIVDMNTFFHNWCDHRQYAIFHSVAFPPDIPMNKNIHKVVINGAGHRIDCKDIVLLESFGMRFMADKEYKRIKLPEMLNGLGT